LPQNEIGIYNEENDIIKIIFNKDNTNLPGNNIFCIAIDNKGNKWFGTDEGLVKFDGKNWKLFVIYSDQNTKNKSVNDVKFELNANQSRLWIAKGNGIFLLDITDPEFPFFQ